jgi:hypothetical protein
LLIPEKIRMITVPLTVQGIRDMEFDSDHSIHVQEIKLSEHQFYRLYQTGVFDVLNRLCNVIIDDFESEVIPYKNLLHAKKEIENVFGNNEMDEVFLLLQLIDLAILKQTGIYFYF